MSKEKERGREVDKDGGWERERKGRIMRYVFLHPQFGGPDVLRVYNKQQLKHRLNLNNLYVVSTRSSGFTVEVTSNVSGQVTMVGVRVMLGLKSLEKAPSFVEIFGRTHPVRCSWVFGVLLLPLKYIQCLSLRENTLNKGCLRFVIHCFSG